MKSEYETLLLQLHEEIKKQDIDYDKIEKFIEKYTNFSLSEKQKEQYLEFLNEMTLYLKPKSEFKYIKNFFKYLFLKNKIISLLNENKLDLSVLNTVDEFFLDNEINLFLNLDEKTIRQIEDKLYRKLKINNLGFDYIKSQLENFKKMNISLAIFLLIDFYKNNRHPALIVTTLNKGCYPNYYNSLNGNINIGFSSFKKGFKTLKNDKETNNLYNIKLLNLIYHEVVHFLMLYNSDEYYYENKIMEIYEQFNVDYFLHDEFYLEYCANMGALKLSEDLVDKLNLKNGEYIKYILNGWRNEYFNKYYEVVEGVRTINANQRIYNLVEHVINSSNYDDNFKKYWLDMLKGNKINQEKNEKIFDDYQYTILEMKKILLVILLEYSQNRTYSNFNRDIIKDLIILNIDDVIKKYMDLKNKNALQQLYLLINKNVLYTDEMVEQSIKKLPMGYPYLEKIQNLSEMENLVYIKVK